MRGPRTRARLELEPDARTATLDNRYLDDTVQGTPGRGMSIDQWRELLVGILITVL